MSIPGETGGAGPLFGTVALPRRRWGWGRRGPRDGAAGRVDAGLLRRLVDVDSEVASGQAAQRGVHDRLRTAVGDAGERVARGRVQGGAGTLVDVGRLRTGGRVAQVQHHPRLVA